MLRKRRLTEAFRTSYVGIGRPVRDQASTASGHIMVTRSLAVVVALRLSPGSSPNRSFRTGHSRRAEALDPAVPCRRTPMSTFYRNGADGNTQCRPGDACSHALSSNRRPSKVRYTSIAASTMTRLRSFSVKPSYFASLRLGVFALADDEAVDIADVCNLPRYAAREHPLHLASPRVPIAAA